MVLLGGNININMAKIKTVCGQCKNNCPEGFTLFNSQEEVSQLVEKFPFYKVIKFGNATVGKIKRGFCVLKCSRLTQDGRCEQRPQNSPAWCKVEN